MKYQYLNISKGEDSYIVSSEFYKFRIEFSYDEDGTLLLHSYYGNGISLDMLDELEQFVKEKFEEDFEFASGTNIDFDLYGRPILDDNAEISSFEENLKILNESPEKFFSTFNINGYVLPQEVVENTVLEEFCKQINEFYKVEFFELAKTKWQEDKTLAACIDAENEIDTLYKAVKAKKGWVWEAFTGKTDKARKSELANWLKDERFNREIHEDYPAEYGSASSLSLHAYDCCGYLFCRIRAIQEEYADILSIPSSCGILFAGSEHIYGIIEFKGFRRAFADVWNRQRGPQAPKLYPTDSDSMHLVKKFTANKSGKIIENEWDNFFSNFPSTVTRTYNEFMNK